MTYRVALNDNLSEIIIKMFNNFIDENSNLEDVNLTESVKNRNWR